MKIQTDEINEYDKLLNKLKEINAQGDCIISQGYAAYLLGLISEPLNSNWLIVYVDNDRYDVMQLCYKIMDASPHILPEVYFDVSNVCRNVSYSSIMFENIKGFQVVSLEQLMVDSIAEIYSNNMSNFSSKRIEDFISKYSAMVHLNVATGDVECITSTYHDRSVCEKIAVLKSAFYKYYNIQHKSLAKLKMLIPSELLVLFDICEKQLLQKEK